MDNLLLIIGLAFAVFMIVSTLITAKKDNFNYTFYFVSNNNLIKYISYFIFIFLMIFSYNYKFKYLVPSILFLSYIWLLFILPLIRYFKKKDNKDLGISVIFLFLNIILTYVILG